jgi:hypothetical protein
MFGFYSMMGGIVSLWFKVLLDKLMWMLFGDQMNKSASKWTWRERTFIGIFLPHHKMISRDKAQIISNRSKYNAMSWEYLNILWQILPCQPMCQYLV